jgi:putative integral membrane protein (TIGR02587 family)
VSRPVSQSLQEYARGVGGGLLFSLPLFYTMEMWAIGLTASPGRLAALVGGTFALLVAYNRVAGIHGTHRLRDDLLESVEEMGLGLAVAAVLLAALGRFPADGLSPGVLGVLTLQAMVAAVGVSVGTAQLGQAPDDNEADDAGDDKEDAVPRTVIGEVVVALCGAVLVAANVAPTEEIVLLGAELTPAHLAALIALSLAVGGGLLYVSAFRGSERVAGAGLGPLRGTVVTYAVALVASAALMWVFGHVEAGAGSLGALVVLSFPAMLGASAGRLLLGSS